MKLSLCLLFVLMASTSFGATISHNIEKLDNGNYKVISTISFNEETGLGRLQMIIPEGINVALETENKLPSKETNDGFSFYIYKSNADVEILYEVSSPSETKEIKFLLKYSNADDRYQQDLAGLVIGKDKLVAVNLVTEPILIGTAVGPKTTLVAGEIYIIQIAALSDYRASWFKEYCKKNCLDFSSLTKWNENSLTKFGQGNYNSKEEGLKALSKLKKSTGISDLFLTKKVR